MVRQALQQKGIELKLEFGDFGIIQISPNDIELLEKNANVMDMGSFNLLIKNVTKDGALSQLPLIIYDSTKDSFIVISGNHRVMASIKAGLDSIPCIIWLKDNLSKDEILRLQLSHNSIKGKDDRTILKELIDSMQDIEQMELTGITEEYLHDLPKVENISLEAIDFEPEELTFMFDINSIEKIQECIDKINNDPKASRFNAAVPYKHSEFMQIVNKANKAGGLNIISFGILMPLLAELGVNYFKSIESGTPLDELGFDGKVNFQILPANKRINMDEDYYSKLKKAVNNLGGWEEALNKIIEIGS